MRTLVHTSVTIFPIVTLLGYMPNSGEDVEFLVKEALEKNAVREEKEIGCAFQLRRGNDGRLTGEVELFPFSSNEEELYLAALYDKYAGDPLEELHWELAQEPAERYYQQVELPGGDSVSYLVQKRKGQRI